MNPLDGLLEDPPFKELWNNLEDRHRREWAKSSYFTEYSSYKLKPVIVKANDDLRQEILAMQLMRRLQKIFKDVGLTIYLRPYEVIVTSCNSGLI